MEKGVEGHCEATGGPGKIGWAIAPENTFPARAVAARIKLTKARASGAESGAYAAFGRGSRC